MYIVSSYTLAVLLCVITMVCWGSWANTQKLAQKSWRFELFYWDYVIGIVLTALAFAFTLGSAGEAGRSFLTDLGQANTAALRSAFIGGVAFNAANILVAAAIAIAGMSVAFPVGIGIAMVLGVIVNYVAAPQGDVTYLTLGVVLVVVAIVLDALAYRKLAAERNTNVRKGLLYAVVGGVLMALFYRFVAASMVTDFARPEAGLLTPYTAVVLFALGILASNFLFNTLFMRRPVEGAPVSYADYFAGTAREHLTGVLGGVVWCIGMSLSILAAGEAGFAISYGLGQGAILVAALWGVFVWREFRGVPGTTGLLGAMFVTFLAGLGLIVYAGA